MRKGDVIGCLIDLTVPLISFMFNGTLVKGSFHDFNLDSMFFPVISCSSKLRYVTKKHQLVPCNKFHLLANVQSIVCLYYFFTYILDSFGVKIRIS